MTTGGWSLQVLLEDCHVQDQDDPENYRWFSRVLQPGRKVRRWTSDHDQTSIYRFRGVRISPQACPWTNIPNSCLLNVIVTMNKCKTTSSWNIIWKREKLTAAASQCISEVDSSLNTFHVYSTLSGPLQLLSHSFQVKLQIDQWNLQRDQGKDIRDVRNALMSHVCAPLCYICYSVW